MNDIGDWFIYVLIVLLMIGGIVLIIGYIG